MKSKPPSSRRPSTDERLDRELRDHIEREVADYVASGMTEAEARRRARIALGGLEQAKEKCRDVRPLLWLSELLRDVRLGFRSLGRERAFAASATIILALGIGISVAMFSVLNAVVLRPLPYTNPAELVRLSTHLVAQNQFDGTSMANFLDWRQQSRSFASMTFYRRTSASVATFTGADAPQRAQEGLVGPEFFALLGAAPLVGRTFSQEEFERREPVVVLSEGLWQEQFGRSERLLGLTLAIDGTDHVVIGVMRRTFQLPTADTRFWRPLSLLPLWPATQAIRDSDQFEVLGRLAPGLTIDDARVEMGLIASRLREAHAVNRNLDIRMVSLVDHVVGSRTHRGVWLGFAAVLSLLLITCANVGGLLSARAARRRRELAVRSALGASRSRLVRQLLAESISLWALASVTGLVLAHSLIRLLLAYGPRALPRLDETGLDIAAFAFAFLSGLCVVALCSTVPALTAAKADATAAFGTRDRSAFPGHRLQGLLVSVQIAGALMLSVGAVLFAQSFIRAQREDPGYRAANMLIVRLDLPAARYSPRPVREAFFRDASERIGRLPGVVAIGGITDFFLRRNADQWVTIEGRAEARAPGARLAIEGVTPGYFRAMGIQVLEGRDFEPADYVADPAEAFIVSETLARRFWPGESAIGKRLVSGSSPPKDGRWSTVIGVVKDLRREGLDVPPILLGFVPAFPRGMDMTIHASSGVEALIPAVRREIRALDGSLPLTQVFSAEDRLSQRLGGRRFETQVLGGFAAIALVLSAAGLYALLAYHVALRTREIGIRSALGADRRSIVTMVLGRGLRLALGGAALGIAGIAAAARVMQSLLYETAAIDAPTYAAAAAFVMLVAATAAWVPARRAAGVGPITALRED